MNEMGQAFLMYGRKMIVQTKGPIILQPLFVQPVHVVFNLKDSPQLAAG
jgi:hypothetical protein